MQTHLINEWIHPLWTQSFRADLMLRTLKGIWGSVIRWRHINWSLEEEKHSARVCLHYRTLILYSLFVINIMNPVMDCVALYDGWLWPGFSSWFLASPGTAFRRKRLNHRLSAILYNPDSSHNEAALMYGVPHGCLENIRKACRISFFNLLLKQTFFLLLSFSILQLFYYLLCFVSLWQTVLFRENIFKQTHTVFCRECNRIEWKII